MENTDYLNFVRGKIAMAKFSGFEVNDADISPILKPHQRDIVKWQFAAVAVRFLPRSVWASRSCRLKRCG